LPLRKSLIRRKTYQITSTPEGSYSLSLPPGTYHIRFEHRDFVTRDLTLQFAPAESRKLDMRLEVAQLSEKRSRHCQRAASELSQNSCSP